MNSIHSHLNVCIPRMQFTVCHYFKQCMRKIELFIGMYCVAAARANEPLNIQKIHKPKTWKYYLEPLFRFEYMYDFFPFTVILSAVNKCCGFFFDSPQPN